MALASPSIVPLRLPTSSKFAVNQETKIEIFSENKTALYYYTLNGAIPDPQKKGDSIFFGKPFTLPAGKITVKAVAVDGPRQSGITTKTFNVEKSSEKSSEKPRHRRKVPREGGDEAERMIRETLNGRDVFGEMRHDERRLQELKYGGKRPPSQETGQAKENRLQDEYVSTNYVKEKEVTHQLKCSRCFGAKKLNAVFCRQCGDLFSSVVQVSRQPDFTTMAHCLSCKSFVPQNLSHCLVCGEPLAKNFHPPPPIGTSKICLGCGQSNPSGEDRCVECHYGLDDDYVGAGHVQASSLDALRSSAMFDQIKICGKCTRTCMGDSRFCDWCGLTLPPTKRGLCCTQCGCANAGDSSFCSLCGYRLTPPAVSIPWKRLPEQVEMPTKEVMASPPMASVGTQTVGLYYPSQREITKSASKAPSICSSRRRPVLGQFSPGKGFWRQQLDHIFGLFRHHCQQEETTREKISHAQIGKLLEARVTEGINEELILSLKFATRFGIHDNKFLGNVDLSFMSDDDYFSVYSHQTTLIEEGRKPQLPAKTEEIKKTQKPARSLDAELLKEISRNKSDISRIRRLIDEGANPKSKTAEGISALIMAVTKQKPEIIKILINNGENVNKRWPPIGNTALHHAVYSGDKGTAVLEELLSSGADPKIRNKNGQSPYDLAVKYNFYKLGEKLLLTEEKQVVQGEFDKYLN